MVLSIRKSEDAIAAASANECTVAIVGGGFAGAALALQLLRQPDTNISVDLFEKGQLLGRGVAYGTEDDCHLLNVPCGKMSAFEDDPTHLLRWAKENVDPAVQPDHFLPRKIYGQYIESLLTHALADPQRFRWRKGEEVVSVVRDGATAVVQTASGKTVRAHKVVLALGNFRPSNPFLHGKDKNSRRYIPFAWDRSALDDAAKEDSVLLVGTGLTAVDIAMSLRARGMTGQIHLLSRRGLLPLSHRVHKKYEGEWIDRPATARGWLKRLRAAALTTEPQGDDWRGVVDSLRPLTQTIWQEFSLAEKRRFLRHVRPYWDVHRHRIAPQVGSAIEKELKSGGIKNHAGRIIEYREDDLGVDVSYRNRRNGEVRTLRVGRVINCTGPETDCRKLNHPLLANLLAQKLVRPDPLFVGLDVSSDGALIEDSGRSSEFLYAIGPARKSLLWESTAVPEIRAQAAEFAALGRHWLIKSKL